MLRKTQTLHIGYDYDVFWDKPGRRQWYFTSELIDLNTTGAMLDGEPVVDRAVFANGRVIDLTHPELMLVELPDATASESQA